MNDATNKNNKPARVIDFLPHLFGRNEKVPDDLVGATIVHFGTFAGSDAEECRLVIDYQPPKSDQVHRLVLVFDETAMWIESC